MKRTINAFAIAASCLLVAGTASAERMLEQRTTIQGPAVIGERTEIAEPETRGTVVSGTTLSGRRELRSSDARIFLDNDMQRATIQDEKGTRNVRVRGLLNPGSVNINELDNVGDDDESGFEVEDD